MPISYFSFNFYLPASINDFRLNQITLWLLPNGDFLFPWSHFHLFGLYVKEELFLLSYFLFVCLYRCGLTDPCFLQWLVSLTIINCLEAEIVPDLASEVILGSFLCVPVTLWASRLGLYQKHRQQKKKQTNRMTSNWKASVQQREQ